jgi:hypothetical protein
MDKVNLFGYYPPDISDFESWLSQAANGNGYHLNYVWFGGQYTEDEVKEKLQRVKERVESRLNHEDEH